MAITAGNVRDIRALAKRVHRRWLEYRRRNPVGDLLAEPGHTSIRDLVSRADRRRLRDTIALLRDLFDLDHETLAEPQTDTDREEAEHFIVPAAEFTYRDHDYPEPLHVFVVPEDPASSYPLAIREVFDSRKRVIRVLGDSMEPELQHGWKLVVDTERRTPEEDKLVAVYSSDRGGLLGRWHTEGDIAFLRKPNPNVASIQFLPGDDWTVWGTVTTIVEAPVPVK